MVINCSLCPHKTNSAEGVCCGVIPFPIKFLEEHKKLFKENGELKESGDIGIVLTPDLLCVFFDRINHNCAIYEERPEVCRLYGNIDKLPCPHFKRSGNPRSPASKKITLRFINEQVDKASTFASQEIKKARGMR
jgi:hypothetical protein